MVELDYTLWIQMANFLVLMFILYVLLYKPMLNILDKREQYLQDLDADAKGLGSEVDEKMARYEAQLRDARQEAMNQKNEISQQGSEQGKVIINEARGEIQQIVEGFKEKIDTEMTAARDVLKSRAEKISVEISEKVLGRSIQ